jgi:hypothetical protein
MLRREAGQPAGLSTAETSKASVSVFDSPAVVGLDEVVESLAVDTAGVRDADKTDSIDALFASL